MRVAVSGSSGLVGSEMTSLLTTGGHDVVRLVLRSGGDSNSKVHWDPTGKQNELSALSMCDGVVHLAGESIAGRRWNDAVKKLIRDSRVKGTTVLCESLANLSQRPKTLICASAIGFYGDRGDEELDEDSDAGRGFLADVVQDWEAATVAAREAGIRVVLMRFGVILSPRGGALKNMLPPFRFGVGGVVGSGKQYWSWISLDDVCTAILHALTIDQVEGAVNVVAPNPVTNHEFTKTLGRVLNRPTVCPLPAFAAELALGGMARELLLSSARVKPTRLAASSFEFQFPELEATLRHQLEKNE